MSLSFRNNSEYKSEYDKSLLDWAGKPVHNGAATKVTQVKVFKTVVSRKKGTSPAMYARRTSTDARSHSSSSPSSTTSTKRPAAPSSLSSLSSLSSTEPSDTEARAAKKPRIENASVLPPANPKPLAQKDAPPAKSASQPRAKAARAASVPPKQPPNLAGALLARTQMKPQPMQLARSTWACEVTSSAESSRQSSPKPDAAQEPVSTSAPESAPTERTSLPTFRKSSTPKSTSARTAQKSTGEKVARRRKKRLLSDLTLPPIRGTYKGLMPAVMVRSASVSRSTTACESDYAPPMLPAPKPRLERQTWANEDGYGGKVARSSKQVVEELSKRRYITFFKNPNSPNDKSFELDASPTVELEYPNTGAKELFLLARPKDEDHYDPTLDIENTLRTFIKDVIPPMYKDFLGPLPEDVLRTIIDSDDSDIEDSKLSLPPISISPPPTNIPPSSSQASSCSSLTALSDSPSPPPPTSSVRSSPVPNGLMRTLIRARNRADGPAYVETLKEINKCILELKEQDSGENILRKVPYTWAASGIPQGVVLRIVEETYQRCVGPKINLLKNYRAFSSNVYGELNPSFVTDIIARTGLRSDSLFLDLGSGVGNVVIQAALATGCRAFGIEQQKDTASLAIDQLEQIKLRCRMWGVSFGDVELEEGDMTKSARVDEMLTKADVVLVNNFVFSEKLNAALRPKFLDLKEGAYVVSLKPFAPLTSQMLTSRNFDDPSAIFDVYAYPYHSGTVSWSSGNGMYYIHHVNREGYKKSREQFEKVQANFGQKRGQRKRSSRRSAPQTEE